MRCNNCGWQNPDGVSACERCGSALDSQNSFVADTYNQQNSYHHEASSSLRSTVREAVAFGENISHESNSENTVNPNEVCRNCGYSLSPVMNVCPQCGTSRKQGQSGSMQHNVNSNDLQSQPKNKQCPKCGMDVQRSAKFCPSCGQPLTMRGTVNAWDNPQNNDFCSLKPIPWSRENTEYSPISYSGQRIILNRANIDPNNQSITSREQAMLTNDGKDWYIEDLSDQHSTMIRVSRKTKLQTGDIIALGNRLFEFRD